MTTNFPEVRLKKYLEMRGTDGGPWRNLCALPAFWVGLLYDANSQTAAWDMIKDWTIEEQETLRNQVPKKGLMTSFRKTNVQELAKEVLSISSSGLKKRARLDPAGNDESGFLDTLRDIAERGRTPAEDLLESFTGKWSGSVDPIFDELQY
jgi:glutamate--cysteine ligase